MLTRNEIEEKYKWNIDSFKNEGKIEKAFDAFDRIIADADKYNGKLADPEMFFACHYDHKKDEILIEHLCHYAFNMQSIDGSNLEVKKLIDRIETMNAKVNQAYSYLEPQMSKLPIKYLKELLKDERSRVIENEIKHLILSKKHRIDEKTSETIAKLSKSFNDTESIFEILTNLEMTFDDALDSNGEAHPISDAEYLRLIRSKDKTLRKNSLLSLMNGYKKYNQTITALYTKDVKHNVDFARLYNFNTYLEEKLFDYVPEKVFRNNIAVVEKNIPVLQELIKAMKAHSGLSDFNYTDMFEDIKSNQKITIEQGQKIMLDALAPLGNDYIEKIKYKLNDQSIDYMPHKNKTSGAYSSGVYNAKNLVLLNWTDDFESVSTLCHEMGHCINAVYYDEQPYEKSDITIFLAEIASLVNETLLTQYMLKKCPIVDRSYYLKSFLNTMRANVFRATLFTQFELYVYSSIENEIPLTNEDLNNKYFELNKKYYGNSCILPEELKYEWSRIPHFYSPYYVFSYSTGFLIAVLIANRILKDNSYSEKYIHFLKNGKNKSPVDILKEIGIDITKENTFEESFEFIKKQVEEFKSLCK